MPYYEVKVTASVSILVRAEDEDDALGIAYTDANFAAAGAKEASSARLLNDAGIEAMRRHADQILE